MEYYDTYNSEYISALNRKNRHYKIKLELLSKDEKVIGTIVKDLSITAQGQLNINNQQLTRRSCSLTLINVDYKYVPSPNNWFWYQRKFKLFIGLIVQNDIYWWSQGVFYTQSVSADHHDVSIEAIDKGGALDGTLKTSMTDVKYVCSSGSNITTLIKDTLKLNMSGESVISSGDTFCNMSNPIDPIVPIIDTRFNKVITQADISVDSNNYIGDLFTELANGYGADVYYDRNGHLRFTVTADSNRVDGYKYMGHQWEYSDNTPYFSGVNYDYSFDGYNAVTVYTNSSTLKNVSYTAYNHNPLSPLRVDAIGVRRMESQEIDYVDVSEEEMQRKCKNYAEYLLFKESAIKLSVSFSSPIIPHMDVNRTIGITDKVIGLNQNTFLVDSLSIPLSAGEMSVTATNINWLPYSMEIGGMV